MPNWCNNTATVHVDSEEKKNDLLKWFRGDSPFNDICPQPEGAEEVWYNWRIENWGTKWEPEVETIHDDFDKYKTVHLDFVTAWGPPTGIYQKLTELGYKVYAAYIEPGMDFCGTYSPEKGDQYLEDYTKIVNEWPREEWPEVLRDVDDSYPLD
jgi:hypothetical protein